MVERFLIVGLRATHPALVWDSMMPGYFCKATENHRRGFQLQGFEGYFSFTTDPANAYMIDQWSEAKDLIAALLKEDPGYFRPITLLTVYV